jgi:hypothetical protein
VPDDFSIVKAIPKSAVRISVPMAPSGRVESKSKTEYLCVASDFLIGRVSLQSETSTRVPGRRWIRWSVLLIVMLVVLAAVFIPAWLIQPFKLQTPERLKIAYTLRHWSPVITPLGLAAALLIGLSLWRGTRGWWRKACLFSFFLPLLLATWFARQNHFEWMFKPLPSTAFANATDAPFVSEGDMVLAVELNGDAAAYPLRQVAYHHVVQDIIGGIPVLVTY